MANIDREARDDGGGNIPGPDDFCVLSEPTPTLASLQGLLDKIDEIMATMTKNQLLGGLNRHAGYDDPPEPTMSGRDDHEAGVTERERQAREKTETEARDREDAEARVIVTREQAMRRIADLEEEIEQVRDEGKALLRLSEQSFKAADTARFAAHNRLRRIKEILDE